MVTKHTEAGGLAAAGEVDTKTQYCLVDSSWGGEPVGWLKVAEMKVAAPQVVSAVRGVSAVNSGTQAVLSVCGGAGGTTQGEPPASGM